MKFKFDIIAATELKDGDIFYCTPNPGLNDFGPFYETSGTDQIFIRDDYYDHDEDENYGVAINGGYVIWFAPEEKVVRLAHYGDLIRVLDMVKMGNPQMQVGPNDFTTLFSKFIMEYPDQARGLMDSLDDSSDIVED